MRSPAFLLSLGTAGVLVAGLLAGPAQATAAQATATRGTAAQGATAQDTVTQDTASGSTAEAGGTTATPAVKVAVGKVKAGPARYTGECPTTVGFSAVISAKGTGLVKYRWARGDGSHGAVKTIKVRGAKKVTVRDRQSFDWDVRGWQAVQIIGRKGLSGKAYFTVSCTGGKPVVYDGVNPLPPAPPSPAPTGKPSPGPTGRPQEPAYAAASVTATPAAYTGPCPTTGQPVRFDALIQVSRVPARVAYQWIDSATGASAVQHLDFAATDARSRTVSLTHPVKATTTGWKAVRIVSPEGYDSLRANYAVTCERPEPGLTVTPTATVDKPAHTGACPTTLTFTGKISVSRTPVEVRYQWRDSQGGAGPVGTLSFTGEPGGKDVAPHTMTVAYDREVPVVRGSGTLRILSPAVATDNAQAAFTVTCTGAPSSPPPSSPPPSSPPPSSPPPSATTASDMKVEPSGYTGPCNQTAYGLQHIVSAKITVTKPMTVKYQWINQQGPWPGPDPFSVTFDAPGSKTVTNNFFRKTSLSGTMRLKIVDPAGGGETADASFNTVCTAEPPATTASDMKVSPVSYTGPCTTPADVERSVSAKITVTGPMAVKYQWVDEQGRPWFSSGPFSTTFHSAGSKTVANGFSSVATARGSVRLKIVDPAGGGETEAVAFSTTCVNPTVSGAGKERTDENEECGANRPAVFQVSAKVTAADGPASVGYRWYRKSNETRNQWVFFGGGTVSFDGTGKQEKTVTGRYSTQRSENGSFKVELQSPYEGSSQTTFLVTCRSRHDR
ncbi:hypothetical protein HS041_22265 [Planomonospora sp. ID67723]|uniref:hypothetical protein n=1 Tax=Planomonospora sp. ID67723 TaxID=2738134 RepID=UPI0018C3E5C2|nr:hypothetical protein [Planomonospora sp. ID67723]MBG0830489.1 hypothetical protein [Planomonospora sp. ID67723]